MAITIYKLEKVIKESFPDAEVKINDLAGDDDHYHLKLTSNSFLGKTKIEQHKMVYKALEDYSVHALRLETNTYE